MYSYLFQFLFEAAFLNAMLMFHIFSLILLQEEDESYSDKSDADFEAALEEAQNMSPPPAKKKSKTKKTKKKKKTKTTSSFPGSEGENDGYEVIISL